MCISESLLAPDTLGHPQFLPFSLSTILSLRSKHHSLHTISTNISHLSESSCCRFLSSLTYTAAVPRITPISDRDGSRLLSALSQNFYHYTPPTQRVETILVIGHSYTAVEGSYGATDYIKSSSDCVRHRRSWPLQRAGNPAWNDFNGRQPSVVLRAYSGARRRSICFSSS